MNPRLPPVLAALGLLCLPPVTAAAAEPVSPPAPIAPDRLQRLVDGAVEGALRRFEAAKLRADEIAVTATDLTAPTRPVTASYRGDVPIYPASVIKLFYLVAAHRWMEDGRLADTPELRRALRDMIVDSYNEATHYVIDLLTETTSGPELPPAELEVWQEKRNAVNRYFASLGYTNINANKKPWCEGPYGRETQAIQRFQPSRNWLTTDATARLVAEIATGRAVSGPRSAQMLELMRRDPIAAGDADPDSQARFTGPALPPGSRLWSKAGWTSETRHDAACIELPDGRRLVLVVFTVNHANERQILHTIGRAILEGMTAVAPAG
jgi:beta-lactamase class A